METFTFARMPRIFFGPGTFAQLPKLASSFGMKVVLVTGKNSASRYKGWPSFISALEKAGVETSHVRVTGEPTPESVDSATAALRPQRPDVVVAIGGGSALDAGKAISAMLPVDGRVEDFLEGIGNPSAHPGTKVPMIAVPTTAGTGSEATKNAVLSRVGKNGFKRSLRHDNFVPDIAVIDPNLALACPRQITASCGMDALTQLLESFVSSKASPMTDALCASGLKAIGECLLQVCGDGAGDVGYRSGMSYAAMTSGVTLANAGLGVVHGIASELGSRFDIPHGVACGTLLVQATATTMRKLQQLHGPEHPALAKYALASRLMFGKRRSKDVTQGCVQMIETLLKWLEILKLPRLGEYGVTNSDAKEIAGRTDNKSNPVHLHPDEIEDIIRRRI